MSTHQDGSWAERKRVDRDTVHEAAAAREAFLTQGRFCCMSTLAWRQRLLRRDKVLEGGSPAQWLPSMTSSEHTVHTPKAHSSLFYNRSFGTHPVPRPPPE